MPEKVEKWHYLQDRPQKLMVKPIKSHTQSLRKKIMNLNKMCQKCKTIMPDRLFIPAILNGKTTGHDLCPVCTYDSICDLHGMKKGTLPTGQFAKEMVLEGRQYQRSASQNALKKKL